jgi:hypothetical protein
MYLPSCGIIWEYRLADLFDSAPQPFFGSIVPDIEELALTETKSNLTTSLNGPVQTEHSFVATSLNGSTSLYHGTTHRKKLN